MKNLKFILNIVLIIIMIFTACGHRDMYRKAYIDQDEEWIRMISDYRKQSAENPEDHELLMSLKRAELDAAEHFYSSGIEYKSKGMLDEAMAALQKGLIVMPGNEKVSAALLDCAAQKEARTAYKEAMIMKEAGNTEKAVENMEKALKFQPADPELREEYEELVESIRETDTWIDGGDKKITIKFNRADAKTVFDYISSSYGFNAVYDEDVKNVPISVSAEKAALDEILNIISASAGIFYKKIGPSALLVIKDTKAKRDQYDDLIIKTFQLNVVKAPEMSTILKNTLNLRRITVNDMLNTISIRDTKDVLRLAEKLINVHDRNLAEVLFDVEIMEVNRTKAEQLGLNYGSRINLTLPGPSTTESVISTTFFDMLRQGTMTLPAFTLNFFKQDVDAKMLANPRVRVVDSKKARIHIGDRVPLRSSTIQDTSGQIRYSYEYKDIGVLLEVTPKINLNNTVSVYLRLEVSTLGSNIGTTSDPAYSIGTRDAETTMLLRDGETAILGGLIRDEERENFVKIPLLGDIPVIGGLFTTSVDSSGQRTDVVLTITPRIIRNWEHIDKNLREIYSGTETKLSSRPKYNNTSTHPKIEKRVEAVVEDVPAKEVLEKKSEEKNIMLSFSEPQYIIQQGQTEKTVISAAGIKEIKNIKLKTAFNPEFVEFIGAEKAASSLITEFDADTSRAKDGIVEVDLAFDPDKSPDETETLAEFTFKGIKKGVSYLIFLETPVKDSKGDEVNVQKKASRLVVK